MALHNEKGPGHCLISVASQCHEIYLRLIRGKHKKVQKAVTLLKPASMSKHPCLGLCVESNSV